MEALLVLMVVTMCHTSPPCPIYCTSIASEAASVKMDCGCSSLPTQRRPLLQRSSRQENALNYKTPKQYYGRNTTTFNSRLNISNVTQKRKRRSSGSNTTENYKEKGFIDSDYNFKNGNGGYATYRKGDSTNHSVETFFEKGLTLSKIDGTKKALTRNINEKCNRTIVILNETDKNIDRDNYGKGYINSIFTIKYVNTEFAKVNVVFNKTEETVQMTETTDRTFRGIDDTISLQSLVLMTSPKTRPIIKDYHDFTTNYTPVKDKSFKERTSENLKSTTETSLRSATFEKHTESKLVFANIGNVVTNNTLEPSCNINNTVILLNCTKNQRIPYDEREIPLIRIISREFQNNTISSIINGTEVLPNDDFKHETYYIKPLNDSDHQRDIKKVDHTISSDTKGTSQKRIINKQQQSLSGRLYIFAENRSITERLQKGDERIQIGLDTPTTCDKKN